MHKQVQYVPHHDHHDPLNCHLRNTPDLIVIDHYDSHSGGVRALLTRSGIMMRLGPRGFLICHAVPVYVRRRTVQLVGAPSPQTHLPAYPFPVGMVDFHNPAVIARDSCACLIATVLSRVRNTLNPPSHSGRQQVLAHRKRPLHVSCLAAPVRFTPV